MVCKNNNKRVSAWKDSSCYCLDAIPYNQIYYSDQCIDFFLAGTDKVQLLGQSTKTINKIVECDSGWKKFGDSCFKSYGDGTKVSKAQDICMEEGANLFYPESHEEMFWVEQFATEGGQHVYIGFRGYDEITKTIINMDYSENTGIRHTTRKVPLVEMLCI